MPEPDAALPLELDGARFRALVEQALDHLAPFLDSLPAQPSFDITAAQELARSLREPLPEAGSAASGLLDDLFRRILPKGFNTAGPGYLAYIPGGGLPASAVAELIANAVNRYVGVFIAAPGVAALEAQVIRWLCEAFRLPATSGGLLTSGGSLANWTALVTARRLRLPEDFLHGTLYASDQVHHSITKAAALTGLPARNVREIGCDERFRMRLDQLRAAIVADRAAGLQPFLIVANAGSTNTGAVDDLAAIADIAAEHDLWMHVDAAYGGAFMLTVRGAAALRGIERADSIVVDPHKGLFLPYGTGCLLVRRQEDLRRAHQTFAEYMPGMQQDADLVDFCEISPELSRDLRGLRLWLPLKLHGARAFRDALDEKLDLALYATARLRALPHIEIVAEPQLSVVAFRMIRPGLDDAAHDALNQDLLARINARKRVYLTPTRLRGRFVIRICVLSFRTHRDRVAAALEDIDTACRELAGNDTATLNPP